MADEDHFGRTKATAEGSRAHTRRVTYREHGLNNFPERKKTYGIRSERQAKRTHGNLRTLVRRLRFFTRQPIRIAISNRSPAQLALRVSICLSRDVRRETFIFPNTSRSRGTTYLAARGALKNNLEITSRAQASETGTRPRASIIDGGWRFSILPRLTTRHDTRTILVH